MLKIARIKLMIAPTTTTHPAIVVIIAGIAGTDRVPLIMPEPTARATMIPTIHVNIPTKLFSFILPPLKFFSSPCGEMEKYHRCHK